MDFLEEAEVVAASTHVRLWALASLAAVVAAAAGALAVALVADAVPDAVPAIPQAANEMVEDEK